MAKWNRKNGRNNGSRRTVCWYCKRPIRGKVWIWGSHPVHKRCHDICCGNLMTGKRLLERIKKSNQPSQKRGFFSWLFGG